jgi:stage V sporulation protein D (sporulation-specific penicillin-binding protein)
VGFAPADDPKIAILVLLDSPGAEDIYVSGGRMAAPVVGNIFADVLPYIGVEAVYEDGEVERTDVLLPNVKNLSVEEAKSTLQSLGFQVQTEGSGETVMDQIPMANVTLASGSTILLYTESEKPADTILVPALLNLSYRDARNTLEELGLYIRYTGVSPSESDTIIVQRQDIEEGSEVRIGSVIEVTLIDNNSTILETAT